MLVRILNTLRSRIWDMALFLFSDYSKSTVDENGNSPEFKNAPAFLLRDARHAMHDILLLRISAILPEAISDGGLTPTTDTDLLLATYRGGSHLTSDIKISKCLQHKKERELC